LYTQQTTSTLGSSDFDKNFENWFAAYSLDWQTIDQPILEKVFSLFCGVSIFFRICVEKFGKWPFFFL
jgi:hypothetical protein